MSIFVVLVASDRQEVRAKFKFSILDINNQEIKEMSSNRPYRFQQGKDWGFIKFIRKDMLFDPQYKLVNNDTINLFCELYVVDEPSHVMLPDPEGIQRPVSQFSEDMGSLLKEGKYTDWKIICQQREFNVHSYILAVRSPTLACFFKHDLAEQENKTIIVDDIMPNILEELLVYVYTDRAPRVDTMASDLLAAADKYELEHLKVLCEISLKKTVCTANAAELYALSDMYHAKQLRAATVDYIINHSAQVMETEGWKLLMLNRPALIIDAHRLVALRNLVPAIRGKKRKKTA
jgi:speckle-type POZ protein